MNVIVTDVNELRKELTISVTATELATEEASILKEFQKQAKVPGFRPGKAPFPMIRKRFHKGLQEELAKKITASAYQFAVKEKDLKVFTVVDASEIEQIDISQDLAVDITVDLNPEFDLPTYKGLSTEVQSTDVTDEEVEQAIDKLRRDRADFKEVERAAEVGDYVKLSYTGSIDGTPISEILADEPANKSWSALENGWEEAGTDEAKTYGVPAVIDGIVGMSAGESKTVTAEFPGDFKIEALQGKSGEYAITVHEVRQRVLPEMNEDFLKSLQIETVEELKARMLDNLEARKKNQNLENQRRQIIEQLVGAVEFPLPETAIEAETRNVMGRIMMENMQRGVAEEDFEKNKEALHAQSSGIAQREVKLRFILSRIAEAESITVDQQDLQRAIMNIAMQQRRAPEELVKELQKDRNQVSQLQHQVLIGKTLDFLAKEATVQTKTVEE